MKSRVCAVLFAVILTGCTQPLPVSPKTGASVTEAIRYVRDARTGLCFAVIESPSADFFRIWSITNVPCTAIREMK